MTAAPETGRRRPVHASDARRRAAAGDKFASNVERVAWAAHQLAVEIADIDPGAVTHALRRAATAQWQPLYLGLSK